MYLVNTWSAVVRGSGAISRAFGSNTGSAYCSAMSGSLRGRSLPPWQVKHVTLGAPAKYCLLIAFIITIIWRAFWIRGVESANFDLSNTASEAWQKVQSLPIELANMPIASKNVSTGMPLSSTTLLKTSSVSVTFSCGACACAAAPSRPSTAIATAPRNIPFDPSFMSSPCVLGKSDVSPAERHRGPQRDRRQRHRLVPRVIHPCFIRHDHSPADRD